MSARIAAAADANVLLRAAFDGYVRALEARLHGEGPAGAALAFQAVTDRDANRLADSVNFELSAAARGDASCHEDLRCSMYGSLLKGTMPCRANTSLM